MKLIFLFESWKGQHSMMNKRSNVNGEPNRNPLSKKVNNTGRNCESAVFCGRFAYSLILHASQIECSTSSRTSFTSIDQPHFNILLSNSFFFFPHISSAAPFVVSSKDDKRQIFFWANFLKRFFWVLKYSMKIRGEGSGCWEKIDWSPTRQSSRFMFNNSLDSSWKLDISLSQPCCFFSNVQFVIQFVLISLLINSIVLCVYIWLCEL